ncbi:tRNA (adenine(58)-N(1))-methyltransferase, mitochondrial [Aplochiton taeniatus]
MQLRDQIHEEKEAEPSSMKDQEDCNTLDSSGSTQHACRNIEERIDDPFQFTTEEKTDTDRKLGAVVEPLGSETPDIGTLSYEEGQTTPTLPAERLLSFGELLIAEYRKKGRVEFRKMFQLQEGLRLQSSWGTIGHSDIAGKPCGQFLSTTRGVLILIRRASLEDYVLYMKRGPAIAYPKDASAMLMMMDVTEGDCVLESGSGSGAMSLFLSRAVGSKGNVLSLEIREDHHRRAVLNYKRWRAGWSLRRGEEWPDNVQFINTDLQSASHLLAGQGFHSIALDMMSPHLVLPTVTPHLHPGAVCAIYLANVTQVIDLLEGLRCSPLPLLCERIMEVQFRDWLLAPAIQKDGRFCTRKAPILNGSQGELVEDSDEEEKEVEGTQEDPPFGSVPYIARPHPEQGSHTAFLVKLRKCVS